MWGFCAARAKTIGKKNAGSHGGEAMAATWYVLHFARKIKHIEGRKSACALKLRSHTGHVSLFWIAGFHESNGYLGWCSSPAIFGFNSFNFDIYYIDSSPRKPRFILVPLRFVSEAWPRAPRMPTNLLQIISSWPLKQGRKKCSKHGSSLYRKRPWDAQREKGMC